MVTEHGCCAKGQGLGVTLVSVLLGALCPDFFPVLNEYQVQAHRNQIYIGGGGGGTVSQASFVGAL